MSIPSLLVAVGVVMLVVAIFGAIGAFRESTLLTNIYACLLSLVFILEISAAIAGFVLQGQVREMLVRTMNESLGAYAKYDSANTAIDFMQRSLECCGVDGPEDWVGIFPQKETSDAVYVPESCCAELDGLNCSEYFLSGCLDRMHFVIGQSAMMIATGATTVAFVQILGVMCAFMLAKTIRRTKSLRAAKRWQLHQSLGIMNRDDKPDYEDYTQLDKSVTYNTN
ncbi:CD63 antigen [Pseudolycoriella hygida]|uniref:Tetraspanin n=1 Tax=Pseudolycoriella hygida TaxID=35572 RepID=A0A9Q0RT37_9DIPT|nr:CD63 antigen [Pseudolycoriella hygida]